MESMKKIQHGVVVIRNPVKIAGTPIKKISVDGINTVRVIDHAQIVRASRNAIRHKESA